MKLAQYIKALEDVEQRTDDRFTNVWNKLIELEQRIKALEESKKLHDEYHHGLCERLKALEPKFKVGDRVRFRGTVHGAHAENTHIIKRQLIEYQTESGSNPWEHELEPAQEESKPLAPLKERIDTLFKKYDELEKIPMGYPASHLVRDIRDELEKGCK